MGHAVFNQVNLVVSDMAATIAFYRRLGVEIPEQAVWRTPSGIHHVSLPSSGKMDFDFDSPELAACYNNGHAAARGRVVLSFRLPSREAVDETWADLIAHEHKGLQPPFDAFWGARYAIVEDPEGNPVGMMSPSDPARRGDPPEL
jgi:catechol 2,3-dioxygenase-like lactoylglutathione lyase family enzyme